MLVEVKPNGEEKYLLFHILYVNVHGVARKQSNILQTMLCLLLSFLIYRNPEAQAQAFTYLREKYYIHPDKLTHLPQLVRNVYQEYHANFDITDMQDKLGKLIYEERCLIQLDSHWKSVFVKDGHIAVGIL